MNSELHNPDNLTDEQIGTDEGWRLLDEDEVIDGDFPELKDIEAWTSDRKWESNFYGATMIVTYRTKLTRAELRAARGLPDQPVSNTPPIYGSGSIFYRINGEMCIVDESVIEMAVSPESVAEMKRELAAAQRDLKESQESADSVCDQLGRAIYDRDRFFADLEVNRSALSDIAKMLNIGNPFIAGFLDEARIEIAKLKSSTIAAKQAQEMADFLTAERDTAHRENAELRERVRVLDDMRGLYLNAGSRPICSCQKFYGGIGFEPSADCPVHGVDTKLTDRELLLLFENELHNTRIHSSESLARAEATEAERDRLRTRLSEEGRLSESAISFANLLEPKLKAALARAEAAEAKIRSMQEASGRSEPNP